MYSKPLPRIVAGAVIAMIAVAALLTFTRGETPTTDTASATLPGASDQNGPVVVGSTGTPTPTSPASADAAERDAENADGTKTPSKTPTSGPTTTPTTQAPDPDPTQEPPPPSPSPTPTKPRCVLLIICK